MKTWKHSIFGVLAIAIVAVSVFVGCKGKIVTVSAAKKNGELYNPDGIPLTYVEGNKSIESFYIGAFEVTQAQWRAVTGGNPSGFMGDNQPVENVSWNDAQYFLKELNAKTGRNYRLPTMAEWDYAANGGTNNNSYEYAGSNDIDDVAWYGGNSGRTTHAVGTKKPNSLGIHDMTGNVWEWCQDEIKGDNGTYCVICGGSWYNHAYLCRVASRDRIRPNVGDDHIGFRVVLLPLIPRKTAKF